jgi:DNA modification methylase
MQVEIKLIRVGERFRKTFEGINELATSIETVGLIEPIILDENNSLIAGERRFRAHLLLKRDTIEVKYMKDLNEYEKKEIELEENIQRHAFTWQEEVAAKAELHKLKQKVYGEAVKGHSTDGTWKVKDTAAALGESIGTVSMDLQLAKGMAAFPELLKEKSKTVAFKKLKQIQDKILNEELAKRIKGSKAIMHPDIINGNCLDVMSKMESESVDLILTDPPYGIDVDEAQTYKRLTMSNVEFKDDEFETFNLLDKAFKEMYRILKPNRHLYIFFAIDKYNTITKLLLKHGFEAHHIPLIWDKGSGSYPSQMTSFVHSYEPFLHVMKGDRKLNGTPRDIFSVKRVPSDKRIHPTQKPTELLRDLIGYSTFPGELILDPFAGSGSTIIAAKEAQRRAIGIELNPIYYTKIVERLQAEQTQEVSIDSDSTEQE